MDTVGRFLRLIMGPLEFGSNPRRMGDPRVPEGSRGEVARLCGLNDERSGERMGRGEISGSMGRQGSGDEIAES